MIPRKPREGFGIPANVPLLMIHSQPAPRRGGCDFGSYVNDLDTTGQKKPGNGLFPDFLVELLSRFELETDHPENAAHFRGPRVDSTWGCAPCPRRTCGERMRSPTTRRNPGRHIPLGVSGAAIQIRTGDLILTKDALYHLSHSSMATRNGLEPSTSSVTG